MLIREFMESPRIIHKETTTTPRKKAGVTAMAHGEPGLPDNKGKRIGGGAARLTKRMAPMKSPRRRMDTTPQEASRLNTQRSARDSVKGIPSWNVGCRFFVSFDFQKPNRSDFPHKKQSVLSFSQKVLKEIVRKLPTN